MIHMMLGTVMDRTRDVAPEVWRRYLGLVLDGLRPGAPAQLSVKALVQPELEAVMRRPR
jgi:hypothetical protein